jgi:hypothetical protein
MATTPSFKLLAVVAVDSAQRVRCQQPHCGHSVYARIHIVEEDDQLLVLGADCFAKRYGEARAAAFTGSGSSGGRILTDEERELLLTNTRVLLAKFEAERQRELELAEAKCQKELELADAKLVALREKFTAGQALLGSPDPQSPDPWQRPLIDSEPMPSEVIQLPAWAGLKKPNSSFFAYDMGNGHCWVLMQSASHTGCFIAPAPSPFESWDEALPASLGSVDFEREVYASDSNINDLVAWFRLRRPKGSRIDSDAAAIQKFALSLQTST